MDYSFVIYTPLFAIGMSFVLSIIWIILFAGVSSDK